MAPFISTLLVCMTLSGFPIPPEPVSHLKRYRRAVGDGEQRRHQSKASRQLDHLAGGVFGGGEEGSGFRWGWYGVVAAV